MGQQLRSFETMAAVHEMQATIMDGDRAAIVFGFRAGDGFFDTLGVPARVGRHFTPADYASGGGPIIVLADRMWRERYNADPSIVGREIVVDGAAHRVVGVMPPGFLPTAYGNDPQFWIPLRWEPSYARCLRAAYPLGFSAIRLDSAAGRRNAWRQWSQAGIST